MAYYIEAEDYFKNKDPEKSRIIGIRLKRELELGETFTEYEDIPVIYHGVVDFKDALEFITTLKGGPERVALPYRRYDNCVYPGKMDNYYAYIPNVGIHFFVLNRDDF